MALSKIYLSLCLVAALVPTLMVEGDRLEAGAFPGWPSALAGYELSEQLPLSEVEQQFDDAFPGRLGRFSDGERQFVVRWVAGSTRRLHAAADCYKALGYAVTPMAPRRGADGILWGCFAADKDDERLLVRERIWRAAGTGSWSDVSSWYWHSTFANDGPYWCLTVVERRGAE